VKQALAWHIDTAGKPQRLDPGAVDLEKHLEDWLVDDIDIIADDILVFSRQPTTTWGSQADLLAIDAQGNVVVIELKRGQTLRETVAQAIEYAAWASTLSYPEISALASKFFGSDDALEARFQQRFSADLPEQLNLGQRIMVVAPNIDSVTETVVEYLAGKLRVPINAVGFDVFGQPGNQTLVRHFVREPTSVPLPAPQSGRPTSRTMDELKAAAIANGVGEMMDVFLSLSDLLPSVVPYYLTFNLKAKTPEKRLLSGISVYPTVETMANAVTIFLGYGNLKAIFGISDAASEEVKRVARANGKRLKYNWEGWDRLEIRDISQAKAIVDAVRAAITTAQPEL